MIKTVLVCLEGSTSGEAAVRVALAVARECGARMSGLAIVNEPDIRAGTPASIGGASYKAERDQVLLAEARRQAAEWQAVFRTRCQDAGVPMQSIAVDGRPAASILTEMDHHDLTVLGKDANFRYATRAEDSDTRERLLHRAPRPLLVVPENAPAGALGPTVLAAYDGSGAARRALLSFADSGLAQGRQIHVACVDDNGESAWTMANRGVQLLAAVGIRAELHNVVALTSNAEALFDLAQRLRAGLVVMGAFAHSRLAQLFTQSTTRKLIEKSAIPLYLQH